MDVYKGKNRLNIKCVQSQNWKYDTCNYYYRATTTNNDFIEKPANKPFEKHVIRSDLSRKLLEGGCLPPVCTNIEGGQRMLILHQQENQKSKVLWGREEIKITHTETKVREEQVQIHIILSSSSSM